MNNNIKKYSGLSLIMGSVLALSGCGVVERVGESNSVQSVGVITTTEPTTEPFAYAGYGYKEYLKEQEKVEPTTVQPTTEPFAYAGYGYKEYLKNHEQEQTDLSKYTDMLYSSLVMSMDGKYAYSRYDDFYELSDDDSLDDICNKFNITINELYSHNPKINRYGLGDVIAYPVMEELYIAHKGDNVSEIAIETGVDIDVILNNNKLNLSGSILNEDSQILLHKFIGNNNSYVTNKGVVNIINNNRIYGNKIVQASGFAGAANYYLALNESVYSYGVNEVVFYAFNCDDSYTSEVVCLNAKDILSVDGMPIALLRNDNDIKALADFANVPMDDMAYMQWGSTVTDGYTVNTSAYNSYVVMNDFNLDYLDVKVKTK